MTTYSTWTEERVEILREGWEMGRTAGEIGRRLGISASAVVGKAHRLGLNGRQSPIAAAVAQGATRRQAERRLAEERASLVPEVRRETVAPEDTGPGDCQWPLGDPGTPGFGFCGAPVWPGGQAPYCREHHARAYVKVPLNRFLLEVA